MKGKSTNAVNKTAQSSCKMLSSNYTGNYTCQAARCIRLLEAAPVQGQHRRALGSASKEANGLTAMKKEINESISALYNHID